MIEFNVFPDPEIDVSNLFRETYARCLASGLGGLMDFSGSSLIYNISPSEAEADRRAMADDWAAVGRDIEIGVETIENL